MSTATDLRSDLRNARQALGLTQPGLAERLGVDISTIWRWENEAIPERGPARVVIDSIISEAQRAHHERQSA